MAQFAFGNSIRHLFGQFLRVTATPTPSPQFRTPEEQTRERHMRHNLAHIDEFATVMRCADVLKERQPELAPLLDSTDVGAIRLFVLTFLARQEENWRSGGIPVRVPHPDEITWEEALIRFTIGRQIADNPAREDEFRAMSFDERRAFIRSMTDS